MTSLVVQQTEPLSLLLVVSSLSQPLLEFSIKNSQGLKLIYFVQQLNNREVNTVRHKASGAVYSLFSEQLEICDNNRNSPKPFTSRRISP